MDRFLQLFFDLFVSLVVLVVGPVYVCKSEDSFVMTWFFGCE
ncbi:MAG: hypothetical protein SPK95_02045 [Veillonella caviae]|nr:hypothetical protein [Veillonella caviae]